MEIGRVMKNPPISSPKRDKKMRSISGLLQGDPMGISGNLTPGVAKEAIRPASRADAYVLTLRNSSNPSDFVSGQRPR